MRYEVRCDGPHWRVWDTQTEDWARRSEDLYYPAYTLILYAAQLAQDLNESHAEEQSGRNTLAAENASLKEQLDGVRRLAQEWETKAKAVRDVAAPQFTAKKSVLLREAATLEQCARSVLAYLLAPARRQETPVPAGECVTDPQGSEGGGR